MINRINTCKKWYFNQSPYFIFLPFLLIYIAFIFLRGNSSAVVFDEGRYIQYAQNLLSGFYSPPFPDIDLWNGPGYPLFLSPFIALDAPLLILRMSNAFLFYFALVFIFKAICIYRAGKVPYAACFLLALYYPCYNIFLYAHTESLAFFLISLFAFFFLKSIQCRMWLSRHLVSAAIILAALAMVKVIFGYVIVVLFFLLLIFRTNTSFKEVRKKSLSLLIISFLLCMPYLLYTYRLTNRPFYWTNSSGMSLYTMSTPFPEEYGDWESTEELRANPNHSRFIDSLDQLSPIEKDDAYKIQAINNIKNNPAKYIVNIGANLSRMFFRVPETGDAPPKPSLLILFPSIILFACIFISLFKSVATFKWLSYDMRVLLLFFLIYLCGSLLVSTYSRMLYITLPFWTLFISCSLPQPVVTKRKN